MNIYLRPEEVPQISPFAIATRDVLVSQRVNEFNTASGKKPCRGISCVPSIGGKTLLEALWRLTPQVDIIVPRANV